MNLTTTLGTLALVAHLALLGASGAAAQGGPCSQCGPGPHWIDSCPGPAGGQDRIANTWGTVGIDVTFDCVIDDYLFVSGSLLIVDKKPGPLDDSNHFPGLRSLDGHLDVIDTEIIQMSMTNGVITLTAGQGKGSGEPLPYPSLGAIAEDFFDPRIGKSFFNVFFEVDLGGGLFAYNQRPMPLFADITCVPPLAIYVHPTGDCLPLYTSPYAGMGMHIANLLTAEHAVDAPQASAEPRHFLDINNNPLIHGDATIRFGLPIADRVEIRVYDAAGRLVRTLVDRNLPAGTHEVVWDGVDDAGKPLARGVYLTRVRYQKQEYVAAKKLTILR